MRKLWFSGGSPYARTVRMLLAEKGLDYEKDQLDAALEELLLRGLKPSTDLADAIRLRVAGVAEKELRALRREARLQRAEEVARRVLPSDTP